MIDIVLDGHSISLFGVAALGSGVGLVAGMFGVGGGFLLVPLLHAVLGVPFPIAVGAGLSQTIATGLGSFLRYRTMGHAESRFDVLLIGGSVLGVHAGARLLDAMSELGTWQLFGFEFPANRLLITLLYSVIFFVLAGLLWWRSEAGGRGDGPLCRLGFPPRVDLPVAGVSGVSGPLVGYIGLCNGILAGMLGIGGGICLIPIMLYGYGFDIRKVAGTGIVVVLVVAVVGTVEFALKGQVHLGLVVVLIIGSALSAQVGANLTRTLSRRTLSRGLAIVLLLTTAALVFKLFRA